MVAADDVGEYSALRFMTVPYQVIQLDRATCCSKLQHAEGAKPGASGPTTAPPLPQYDTVSEKKREGNVSTTKDHPPADTVQKSCSRTLQAWWLSKPLLAKPGLCADTTPQSSINNGVQFALGICSRIECKVCADKAVLLL